MSSENKMCFFRKGRDSQRSKLYKSEFTAAFISKRFKDLLDAQCFLDSVIDSKWFKNNFPSWTHRIILEDGRGRKTACAIGERRIKLPKGYRNSAILLHELAHCVVVHMTYGQQDKRYIGEPVEVFENHGESIYIYSPIASHGWQFAKTYLELVKKFDRPEVAKTLERSFKHYGIKYKAPRKRRAMTEEQRQAAAERLEKARAVRMANIAAKSNW